MKAEEQNRSLKKAHARRLFSELRSLICIFNGFGEEAFRIIKEPPDVFGQERLIGDVGFLKTKSTLAPL